MSAAKDEGNCAMSRVMRMLCGCLWMPAKTCRRELEIRLVLQCFGGLCMLEWVKFCLYNGQARARKLGGMFLSVL